MKEFECSSDIGSVLIGNDIWTFAVPNKGGDGTTYVRVYDSEKEFWDDAWDRNFEFVSSAQGTFGVFAYDCDYHDLLRHQLSVDDAVTILTGRYGIYRGFYKMAFVKWED